MGAENRMDPIQCDTIYTIIKYTYTGDKLNLGNWQIAWNEQQQQHH